jgi:hypothetical protein
MTADEYGMLSQHRIGNWLLSCGIRDVRICRRLWPFDALVNGKRVEMKAARFSKGKLKFNIHRHNVLDESSVDVYILRLDDFPYSRKAVHLVIPAPIGRHTVSITIRSLLSRYHRYIDCFGPFNLSA